MNKIIHETLVLKCGTQSAFEQFTDSAKLATWLAMEANVEARVGGAYELFWDVDDHENDSTIGCKITALAPGQMVAFEWKGPRQFKDFMNNADPLTHCVVSFSERDGETVVNLVHSGWHSGDEWQETFDWHVRAWQLGLSRLEEMVNAPDEVPAGTA